MLIAVNDFDAKKSARYNRVLDVTELVVSGNQCIQYSPCRCNSPSVSLALPPVG